LRSSTLLTLTTLAFALTAGSAQAADLTAGKAQAVADSLGSKGAGAYFDSARGEIVVAVTDEAAADKVEAAGGTAEIVEHSTADLEQVKKTIDTTANVTGMAWAVDPAENKVVITVDQSVDATELRHVQKGVAAEGDAVRIERVTGTFSPYISGGHAIYAGGSRCSLGFNVRRGGVDHFLTAGHCTNIGASWTGAASVPLGTVVGTSFPTNDYGLVRYTNASVQRPGNVWLYNGTYQEIATARNAIPGEPAKRSGSTTGLRSGTIQAVNQTVRYPQGTVSGLIRTNICAQPGDSGGPLFNGTAALGLTSGGSGNCTTGGTTFYQPVTEALAVYGAQIY
jgi:streptogrisin D